MSIEKAKNGFVFGLCDEIVAPLRMECGGEIEIVEHFALSRFSHVKGWK